MRNLLDQQVVSMRRVQASSRQLRSYALALFAQRHRSGGKKGSDFGREKGGNTVVTDAKNMSGAWRTTGCVGGGWTDTKPGTRVTDLVKTGGKDYNLFFSNCHFAARNAAKFAAEKK
uniref:Mrr_cat domain-containing protein n=1 Tax=Macrostomum lignano TaxID=282301 RepID=A0A1I8FWJ8_9PLAT